jgi:integrase
MTVSAVLDAAGRRRSPATLPGYHAGRPPRNKGRLYPADPPSVEEIVAVMREAGDDPHGYGFRALVVVLWRGGLRVAEALALGERDLDPRRGSLLVRNGKGDCSFKPATASRSNPIAPGPWPAPSLAPATRPLREPTRSRWDARSVASKSGRCPPEMLAPMRWLQRILRAAYGRPRVRTRPLAAPAVSVQPPAVSVARFWVARSRGRRSTVCHRWIASRGRRA